MYKETRLAAVWRGTNGSGPIHPTQLMLSPVGAECIYTRRTNTPHLARDLTSYATRHGARIKTETLAAFNSKSEAVYLLRATVIKRGKKR